MPLPQEKVCQVLSSWQSATFRTRCHTQLTQIDAVKSMNQKRGKNMGLNIIVVHYSVNQIHDSSIMWFMFEGTKVCVFILNCKKFRTLVPAKNSHLKVWSHYTIVVDTCTAMADKSRQYYMHPLGSAVRASYGNWVQNMSYPNFSACSGCHQQLFAQCSNALFISHNYYLRAVSIPTSPWKKKDRPRRSAKSGCQYQASSAVLGWLGDGDCYLMHKVESSGWLHLCSR